MLDHLLPAMLSLSKHLMPPARCEMHVIVPRELLQKAAGHMACFQQIAAEFAVVPSYHVHALKPFGEIFERYIAMTNTPREIFVLQCQEPDPCTGMKNSMPAGIPILLKPQVPCYNYSAQPKHSSGRAPVSFV